MPPPFKRADRVGDLLHKELSALLLREVKDPRLHAITVTGVRVSTDLRHARVLFTGGPEAEREAQLQGLRSATGFLRGQLGRRLDLRYAPELTFVVDESVDKTLEVMRLLREVKADTDE
jgi:ribosome-binding factor A